MAVVFLLFVCCLDLEGFWEDWGWEESMGVWELWIYCGAALAERGSGGTYRLASIITRLV